MTLPGETISPRTEDTCECGEKMPLQVLRSFAGYYIGTACSQCGPNSRDSGYYPTQERAQQDFDAGLYSR